MWFLPTIDSKHDVDDRWALIGNRVFITIPSEGDMRLFMMNGQPLRYKNKYAAFRRLRSSDDIRSNIHAGGEKAKAVVDDVALHIVEIVRPKLVEDGMFLVSLDIVGRKLMEINDSAPAD
jgi:glutathione synthase